MSHPFDADLVVADTKFVGFTDRLEVIVRVNAGYVCKRQDALFGEQVVELKLAQLDVQPGTARNVVDAGPDGFEVERRRVIRGRKNVERIIIRESSGGVEIQTTPVKSVGRDGRFVSAESVRSIHLHLVGAFTMPDRRDTERNGPVSRLLKDGGIAIVSHLVSVVFELLPKRAQLRPRLMARGTWHAVFSCECGKGAGWTDCREENSEDHCNIQKSS